MEIPRNPDITYFAKTNYRDIDKQFGIKRRDRRQHMYVLGKSGTGKSALIKNMIVQNIANGEGVAVVDPHGELVEDILELIPPERADDVVYFNPADTEFHTGFNMLEVPDPKYKHLIASGLMGIFTKIWANAWSSRMEYILNNAILALIETPGSTMLGIPRLLVDQDYRQFILDNVTDPVVKAFWINEFEAWQERFRNEAIAPIQNKVGQFLSTAVVRNIVGQSKSTINIFDIMNTKKILLVNVSKGRIGEDNSSLLGAMMITKLQLAAMERVRIPEEERKDFYLYVDEFQNFVTESFASILSEARKYRLCLTVAHQYIGQLSTQDSVVVRDAVFGNVGTMIIFRVGAADAEFLEPEFQPEFTTQDFVKLPNYHIYTKLMIDGVTSRPFSAKTLQPFTSEGSEGTAKQIIDRSRELYARPREDVENEITNWARSKPGQIAPEDVPDKPAEAKEGKDGKFRIKCSLFEECGNIAEVPFKPEPGRPVYCREHIEKLKNGEIQPIKTKPRKPNRDLQDSMSTLAGIGIAFKPETNQKKENKERSKKVGSNTKSVYRKTDQDTGDKTQIKNKPLKLRQSNFSEQRHTQNEHDKNNNQKDESLNLKEVLQEVLGKKNLNEMHKKQNTQTKQQEQNLPKITNEQQKTKQENTISLASLKKNHTENEDILDKEKNASGNTRNALKDAIARATSASNISEQNKENKNQEKEIENLKQKLIEKDAEIAQAITKKETPTPHNESDEILRREKEKFEARAREAQEEIERERRAREEAEKKVQQQASEKLAEEQKRRELEQKNIEVTEKLAQIETEKERIAREKSEAERARKQAEENERRAHDEAMSFKSQLMAIASEKEAITQQMQQKDANVYELMNTLQVLEERKKQVEQDRDQAQNKAEQLEQEKNDREEQARTEASRKEVPEDILKSILD